MPALEVLAVDCRPEPAGALLGASIDLPVEGDTDETHVMHVAGWVAGRASPAARVELLHRDRVIRHVPVVVPRPDVTSLHPAAPERCGFEELVGLVGLGAEFELMPVAVLEDGTRVRLGSIRGSREAPRGDYQPVLRPLVVSCLGRSGTTLLMRCLAAHPRIVAYRRYPYESSPARYWLHVLRVLSEPGNFVDSTHPDTFLEDVWSVGWNPFYDYGVALPEQAPLYRRAGGDYVRDLSDFCLRAIDKWYLATADMQGQPEPLYFAEKHMWPGYTQDLVRDLYPKAKEVFLVRDFRDMTASILAFDEKRGFAGFRRPSGKSDEQYVREDLGSAAEELREAWRRRADHSHLVRYEDLVLRPDETVRGLLEYLELEAPDDVVREVVAAASASTADDGAHRTSSDPRDSIGRWRTHGDPAMAAVFEEVFGDVLADFGYAQR